jgi:hypothetical protein
MHQAVRDSIRKHGLPRPMCVMAASNGAYPFFDAPVMSSEEYLEGSGVEPVTNGVGQDSVDGEDAFASERAEEASSGYESLLSLSIRRTDKKPVLMLDSAEAAADARANELDAMQRFSEPAMPAEIGLPVEIETPEIEMPEPVEPAAGFAHDEPGIEPAAPVDDHYGARHWRDTVEPTEFTEPAEPVARFVQGEETAEPAAPADDHHEPQHWTGPAEPLEFAEPTLPETIEPVPSRDFVEPVEPVASAEPAAPMEPIEPIAAFEDHSATPDTVEEEARLPQPAVEPARPVASTLEEKLDMWMKRLEIDRARPAEPAQPPIPSFDKAEEPPRPAAFEPVEPPVVHEAPADLPEPREFVVPEPVEETPAPVETAAIPDWPVPEPAIIEPVEETPAPVEATAVPAYSAPEPEIAEPQIAQPAPPRPKPVPAPAGHSLRAKIAQTQPPRQKTLIERIVAVLQNLGWLK